MNKQLFKIVWKIPYVAYETYIAAVDEEDTLRIFEKEVFESISKEMIIEITAVEFNGVIKNFETEYSFQIPYSVEVKRTKTCVYVWFLMLILIFLICFIN